MTDTHALTTVALPRTPASRSVEDPDPGLDWERIARTTMHPTQVAVLRELAPAEASPNDLAERLGEPLGNVSYHVRRLQSFGLIELVRTAQRRGAIEHFYVLAANLMRRD